MTKKVIFLDLDDVIIPWKNFQRHQNEKKLLEAVKSNINFITNFARKNRFKIFLISTWSISLDNNFEFIQEYDKNNKLLESIRKIIFSDNNKNLFIGKGNKHDIFGNYDKTTTILDFIENNPIQLGIILEDSDFTDFANEYGLAFIKIKNNEDLKKIKIFSKI